jgi:flagellar export protein FliJ
MPPYRLQTLLDMREKAEEDAKQAFSESVRALAKEEGLQKSLEQQLVQKQVERKGKVSAYMAEVMKNGVGAGGLSQLNRFEQRLKDEETQLGLEIDRQKEAVRQAQGVVEQRRAEMAEAAKEKKAIEKHKEGFVKQVKAERAQKEEMSQEEIGNTLHLKRTREASRKP